MITIGDLEKLISQWKLKLAEPDEDLYDTVYKDGINDCLYDLTNMIGDIVEQESRAFEYMNQI